MKCVAGYLIVNDVSVRDWQLRSPTTTFGKSFDNLQKQAAAALK